MNTHAPILIASPIRSGTTLLAGFLNLHGVWIGKGKITRAKETNSLIATENTQIKQYLKNLDTPLTDFKKEILSFVDTDGPWLVKTAQNLLRWRIWNKHFPDARWLLPQRPLRDIVESSMRHPAYFKQGRLKRESIATYHKTLQEKVKGEVRNSLWVKMDLFAARDLTEINKVMTFCDLELNEEHLTFINPEMWHGDSRLPQNRR